MYYFNILKANYGSKASKKEREAQEAERQSAANTMSEGAGSRHHSDRNLAEGRKIGDRFGDWKTRPIDIEDTEDVYFPEGIFDRLRDQTVPVSIREDSGDCGYSRSITYLHTTAHLYPGTCRGASGYGYSDSDAYTYSYTYANSNTESYAYTN